MKKLFLMIMILVSGIVIAQDKSYDKITLGEFTVELETNLTYGGLAINGFKENTGFAIGENDLEIFHLLLGEVLFKYREYEQIRIENNVEELVKFLEIPISIKGYTANKIRDKWYLGDTYINKCFYYQIINGIGKIAMYSRDVKSKSNEYITLSAFLYFSSIDELEELYRKTNPEYIRKKKAEFNSTRELFN